jgi:hypothetical protein
MNGSIFVQSLMEAQEYVQSYASEAYRRTPGRDVSRLECIVHMLLTAGLQM